MQEQQPPIHPYRKASFGKIYDHVEAHKAIDFYAYSSMDRTYLQIDEENLELERVSMDTLLRGWKNEQESFSRRCKASGIDIDPFIVFLYLQVQSKTFRVLGAPILNEGARLTRLKELGRVANLSQTAGHAMCSEYAILSSFIAQKVERPIRLIIGMAINPTDPHQWREVHAFGWDEDLNVVFDSVQARAADDMPALMVPTRPSTLTTMEEGFDIEAQRIGNNFKVFYGLEPFGFGPVLDH